MGVPLVHVANDNLVVRNAIKRLLERCADEFRSEDDVLQFFQYLAATNTSWTRLPRSWQRVLFDALAADYAQPLSIPGLAVLLHAMTTLEIQWATLTPALQWKLWRYIRILLYGKQTWLTSTSMVSVRPSPSTLRYQSMTLWALASMGWTWHDFTSQPNGIEEDVIVNVIRRVTTERPYKRILSQLIVGLTNMKCLPYASPAAAEIWRLLTDSVTTLVQTTKSTAALRSGTTKSDRHDHQDHNSSSGGSGSNHSYAPYNSGDDMEDPQETTPLMIPDLDDPDNPRDESQLATILLRALAHLWYDAPASVFETHADAYLWTSFDRLLSFVHPQFMETYSKQQLIAVQSITAFLHMGLPEGVSAHHLQQRDALLLKYPHIRLPEEVFCPRTFAWRWELPRHVAQKASISSSLSQTEILHALRERLPAEAGYLIVHEFAGLGQFFPMDLAIVYIPWRSASLQKQLATRVDPSVTTTTSSSSSSVARAPHPWNGAAIVAMIEVDGPFHYQQACTPPSLDNAGIIMRPTESSKKGANDLLRRADAFKAMLYQRQFPQTPLFLRMKADTSSSSFERDMDKLVTTVKKTIARRQKAMNT